jgi:hypothetical protein
MEEVPDPAKEEADRLAAEAAKVKAEADAKAAKDAADAAKAEAARLAAQANETPEQKLARIEAELKKARDEAGKTRVNAKAGAAKAAEAEMLQKISVALGLVPEETPDPAKLMAQVAEAQGTAKQATLELSIFRAAGAAGANAPALLDSRSFLNDVADIDPKDSAALTAAITKAVTENPLLARAPAGPVDRMRPNPAQGSSANAPLGIQAQIAEAEKRGDIKEALRLKLRQTLSESST